MYGNSKGIILDSRLLDTTYDFKSSLHANIHNRILFPLNTVSIIEFEIVGDTLERTIHYAVIIGLISILLLLIIRYFIVSVSVITVFFLSK